jgi:hypothetical protein
MSLKLKAHFAWTTTGLLTWALTLGTLTTSGCTFKTPAPTTPVTNSMGEMIPKTFFMKKGGVGAEAQTRQKILAGWAVIDAGGAGESHSLKGVPLAGHLNLQWEITEKFLLGRKINPTFDTTTNNSQVVVKIPIVRHYYYEKELDQYNRETNRYIKNESRDSWMHRPYMDLDLGSITFLTTAWGLQGTLPYQSFNATDIEWDINRKFLGFSVEVSGSDEVSTRYSSLQAKMRVNFLAFDTDTNFKPTPFNSKTARNINVLHVLGKKVNGLDTGKNYAGHWKLPVTFATFGVPREYMPLIEEVVYEWNQAFKRAGIISGNESAVLLDKTPMKYPLDLRHPTINWTSDRRTSQHAPLGIGQAAADVSNGQFLYGSVNIWAGIIEDYINRHIAAVGDGGGTSAETISGLSGLQNLKLDNILLNMADSEGLINLQTVQGLGDYLKSPEATQKLKNTIRATIDPVAQDMQNQQITDLMNRLNNAETEDEKKFLKEQISVLQGILPSQDQQLDNFANIALANLDQDMIDGTTSTVAAPDLMNWLTSIAPDLFSDMPVQCEAADPNAASGQLCQEPPMSAKSVIEKAGQQFADNQIIDSDRTIADFALEASNIAPGTILDEKKIVWLVLKDLVLHEMGHVLGLGHNFKGNILPQRGTVPEDIYQDLKKQWLAHQNDPSAPDMVTTVMDYGSPLSNVNMKDVKPGPYDEMMLKYLYQAKYPAIAVDNASDVRYIDITDENGVIPDVKEVVTESGAVKKYKTAFLPACNDIEASFTFDPLCSRWDRGANATEIVKNRFANLNSMLPSLINAFSGAKGGYSTLRERMLWYRALDEFSKIRVVYDRMRTILDSPNYPYRDAFATIRGSSQALYNFSKACLDPSEAPDGPSENKELYRDAFATLAFKNPAASKGKDIKSIDSDELTEVRDLCQANLIALTEWRNLLSREGSDYTTMDIMRRYAPGGITGGETTLDWGYLWGAYKEIGSFPLRFTTLYAVTAPSAYLLWGGIYDNPIYSQPDQLYSYSALYPREFSSIISTAVKENLNLGGGALEAPTELGKSLLYLSYFLKRNRMVSKDSLNRFPSRYIDDLRGLTDFEITMSPVILTNTTNPNKATYLVYKYKAAYLDLAKQEPISIPWAYLLPDRRVIAKGIDKQMFLPITKFRYLSDTWGYVWALDVRYQNNSKDDGLKGNNAKLAINSLYQKQMESCELGANGTGLSYYFVDENPDFEGFEVQSGIAFKRDLQDRFEDSLKKAYDKYYKWNVGGHKPSPNACDDTMKGLSLIVGGAALINGFWMPQIAPFIN